MNDPYRVNVLVVRARRDRVTGWVATCSACGHVGEVVAARKAVATKIASRHITGTHAGHGLVRVQK